MQFSWHRPKTWAFLGFLSLLLALVFGIWWTWDGLIRLGLQQLLQQTSTSTPLVSGARFNVNQAEFSKLQFDLNTPAGPLTLRLDGVNAGYDIQARKLNTLSVASAQIQFELKPVEKSTSHLQSEIPVLPLQQLTVDTLDLQIGTPWGDLKFTGRAELNVAEKSEIQVLLQDSNHSLRLELTSDWRHSKLRVQQSDGNQIFELTYQQPDDDKQLVNLEADAAKLLNWLNNNSLIPADLRGHLAASVLVKEQVNISGIKLKLNAVSQDNLANLQGRLMLTRDKADLASAEWALKTQNMQLTVDGYLDLPAAELMVLIKPWLPETAQSWQPTQGMVLGNVGLSWQPQSSLTGSLSLKARQIDLAIGSIHAQNGYIQLEIKTIGSTPWALKIDVPNLSIGQETKLHDLLINVKYQHNRLTLDQAGLPVFGGRLEILSDTVNIKEWPINLTLEVKNLNLTQLLDSLNVPNLSGTGLISGRLPLRLGLETVEVNEGVLNGAKPGVLRYQTPVTDPENIAFSALRNLLYHSLQARINYRPNGDYQIGLRLEGKNPHILSGHPLAFNLNLHGQLPDLLQKGILAGNFEQPILEQIHDRHKH